MAFASFDHPRYVVGLLLFVFSALGTVSFLLEYKNAEKALSLRVFDLT